MAKRRTAPHTRPLAETMEDRVLHSADLAPLLLGGAVGDTRAVEAPAASAESQRSEIVFIDTQLPDAVTLLADLQAQRDAGRPLEIVRFGAADDGLAVISDTLAGRSDVAAVHVLAHGSDGVLQLGATQLDANALMQRAGELAGWSDALTADADLLLYGCDLAETAVGQGLVRDLAALTGADVAASTDLTGAAAAGGDWALEFSSGRIDAAGVLSAAAQQRWAGTLTAPVNTVPGAQSTGVTTPKVFSAANGNAISITDADAGGASNEVTLGVTSGSLTLAGTTGLTFIAGDGTADASMTMRGSAAAINAALDGLSFAPAPGNASATLTLSTLDSTLVSLNNDASLRGRYGFDAGDARDDGPGPPDNGSLQGGAAVVTDATRGQVLGLDGSGDFVRVSGHFGNPAVVTLAAWINLATATTFGGEVISLGDSVALRVDDLGNLKGFLYDGSAWKNVTYATTLAGTGWHHVAYTFDSTANVQTLYLDGVAVASIAETGSVAYTLGSGSTIGTHGNAGAGHDFDGRIDDARIYARALTAGEIGNLAADLGLRVTDSVAISIVNTAPSLALPASVAVTQDSVLAFSDAGGNAIKVADAESASLPIQLDLAVSHGTLALQTDHRLRIPPQHARPARTSRRRRSRSRPTATSSPSGRATARTAARTASSAASSTPTAAPPAPSSSSTRRPPTSRSTPASRSTRSGRFVVAWQSYDTGKLTLRHLRPQLQGRRQRAVEPEAHHHRQRRADDARGGDGRRRQRRHRLPVQGPGQRQFRRHLHAPGQRRPVDDPGRGARQHDDRARPVGARGGLRQTAASSSSGRATAPPPASASIAQRYTTAGAKVGGDFIVNAFTAGDQTAPAVAMTADGRFVVAWESANQDNADGQLGVYAQRFAADGSTRGGEFRVNTVSVGDQHAPAVAITADGRFTIAWTSKGQDNADGKEGVYAQGFADNGSAQGPEFRLNTTTVEPQAAPALGMAADGNLVGVWQSDKQDGGGEGIYGQRFLRPGAVTFVSGTGVADTALTVRGAAADLNTALNTLRFTPDAGYWGPATLSVTADDLGAGAGPALSVVGTVPIDVQKINVGPVNTVPAAQATNEDTPLVFSVASGNAIQVADVDADPLPVQVTLAALNGTRQAGADHRADGRRRRRRQRHGDGAGPAGRPQRRARRPGLHARQPTASGADTLTVTTNDLGHSTVGGPYTAISTVAITVGCGQRRADHREPGQCHRSPKATR